jgi:hypothetical protein
MQSNRKQILVTFDYEMFLGNRSGSVDDCMIVPTRKLMAIMKRFGVKALFFVDTVCLLQLKRNAVSYSASEIDFSKVTAQLKELVAAGHDIFPHIHPHWLDAVYIPETNEWKLNNTRLYRFHNVSETDQRILFTKSVELLKEIVHTQKPDYHVSGYRAGGWCIQPFSDFLPLFRENNILYEFSVLKDFYQFTDAQYFDFSETPHKDIYRFSDDICREDPSGSLTQFTISSLHIPPYISLLNKLFLKIRYNLTGDHTFLKGEGQPSVEIHGLNPVSPHGKHLGTSSWERVSVELLTSVKLNCYLDFLKNHPFMHFISHPKMVTAHNLYVFDKFLYKAFDQYEIETDFRNMIPGSF